MKIACIGGGPAGLYLGILVKRTAPEHDVVVYERNRPADTFGFGVVFSDATLGHLASADPESHAQITAQFARWDDIEIHVGGEVLRSTGHGFCGLERKSLLQILQARAKALGVRVEFEHEIKSLSEVKADLVVACDGVASWVRDALAADIKPDVDVRPNKFVWLGCTVPYRAFTFIFKDTPAGLYRVHAYPYRDDASTFIVECTDATWRAAGLDRADEDGTIAILQRVFERELAGHRLVKNRSIWRNFPTVRCGAWSAGNVVLVGDAAHTAHFSIGSGTKLAMEDVIVLRDEVLATSDIRAALVAYEARRRPEVEALQAAAQASLAWFEGTERYMKMTPMQLTYSLMTRSLRVSHASVGRRDPHLARGVEKLLATTAGVTRDPPPAPTALPFAVGDRALANRIVVAPVVEPVAMTPDDSLVMLGAPAAAGAGLVVTPPLALADLAHDDAAVAWSRVVEFVHGKGGAIALRLVAPPPPPAGPSSGTLAGSTRMPAQRAATELDAAIRRAAFAGFDLLILDSTAEHLAATLTIARPAWRPRGWIAAAIRDRADHARGLIDAGADMLWVASAGDPRMAGARIPSAPLADQLRNDLAVPTAIEAGDALLPDLDAVLAAGRADLVVVGRMPAGAQPSPRDRRGTDWRMR